MSGTRTSTISDDSRDANLRRGAGRARRRLARHPRVERTGWRRPPPPIPAPAEPAGAMSAAPLPPGAPPVRVPRLPLRRRSRPRSAAGRSPRKRCRPPRPRTSRTTPPAGAGDVHRRLVALEGDQGILGPDPIARPRPGFSMTGTSEKSPMSGTRTSVSSATTAPLLIVPRDAAGPGRFHTSRSRLPPPGIPISPSSASAFSAATATWNRSISKNRRSPRPHVAAPEAVGARG